MEKAIQNCKVEKLSENRFLCHVIAVESDKIPITRVQSVDNAPLECNKSVDNEIITNNNNSHNQELNNENFIHHEKTEEQKTDNYLTSTNLMNDNTSNIIDDYNSPNNVKISNKRKAESVSSNNSDDKKLKLDVEYRMETVDESELIILNDLLNENESDDKHDNAEVVNEDSNNNNHDFINIVPIEMNNVNIDDKSTMEISNSNNNNNNNIDQQSNNVSPMKSVNIEKVDAINSNNINNKEDVDNNNNNNQINNNKEEINANLNNNLAYYKYTWDKFAYECAMRGLSIVPKCPNIYEFQFNPIVPNKANIEVQDSKLNKFEPRFIGKFRIHSTTGQCSWQIAVTRAVLSNNASIDCNIEQKLLQGFTHIVQYIKPVELDNSRSQLNWDLEEIMYTERCAYDNYCSGPDAQPGSWVLLSRLNEL